MILNKNTEKNISIPFPKYISIETVKRCNARCVFCAVNEWPKHTPVMSDELYEDIFRQIKEHAADVEQVYLHGNGEPLLDKKLIQRVCQFKTAGVKKLVITTNASLLNQTISEELLNAGLDEIFFSFNGLNKDKYEKVRVGLNFDTVMANALGFIELRNRINPATRIRMRMEVDPIFSDNDVNEWMLFWRKKLKESDEVYAKKLHNWGNQIEKIKSTKILSTPCPVLWTTMTILSDGQVALCCIDYAPKIVLGNLNTHSIKDVWMGKELSDIRTLHLSGLTDEISLCKGCKLWDADQKIF
ncbi:MAG: radical SAM protein [Chlorobium sp.]